MDIKVTFTSTEQRDAFANRWKVEIPDGVDHIDVPWHLVQHALKNESAVEYTQLDTETEHEFLVSGDKNCSILDRAALSVDIEIATNDFLGTTASVPAVLLPIGGITGLLRKK